MEIKLIERKEKKPKPNQNNLGFGQYFTDYMFEMDYYLEKGWINPTIKPYGPINIEPSAMVLHYGQSVFEGLKAYLDENNQIRLFRPYKNIERLNKSNVRMCIPEIDENMVLNAITELLKIDKEWIPIAEGTSLYIRPFVFASDGNVGVRPSYCYKFMIILSPVGAFYQEGFNPIKIYVEQSYVRAVRGGIGEAKTAGNYAASIMAQSLAKKKGFSQVLWLDGVEQKYIEEVGTMNVFFKINNEVFTPELNGSILDGVTRNSVIQLLKDIGYKVTEKRISIEEIIQSQKKGELEEVFGTGTAAVISPVGEIWFGDEKMVINDNSAGKVTLRLYDLLTKIQRGKVEDKHNWTVKI
ncbi:MAG: branched chain amino acid aminotransferase [Flavobacteriaceae bacterium CG_4_9_14_3_um_filter_33_16]|nr:MAG: branched chain amino acid aminotransferase [Flavobacteriaceae bacterium CG_4_9_14_3_um_filter_33_16]